MRIKAIQITIDRAEGPTHLTGPQTFEGNDVWEKAQRCINEIRQTAPKMGYDKTDFQVTFSDGETYKGRIDLKHPDNPRPEESDLAKHIAQELLFHAGCWCPPHMKLDTYHRLLSDFRSRHPNMQTEYLDFVTTYDIPCPWIKTIVTIPE